MVDLDYPPFFIDRVEARYRSARRPATATALGGVCTAACGRRRRDRHSLNIDLATAPADLGTCEWRTGPVVPPPAGAPPLLQRPEQAATVSGIIGFPQRAEVGGEVTFGAKGVGVVRAEDLAAARQGILIQITGRLHLPQLR